MQTRPATPTSRIRIARSSKVRTVAGVALWALAAAHLAEAAVLRRRRRRLATLVTPGPVSGLTGSTSSRSRAVAVRGTAVDPRTRAMAEGYLRRNALEVVDLVPGDLPARRALRLLRRVDPHSVSDDVLFAPGGAHQALVATPGAVGRAGIVDPAQDAGGDVALGTGEVVRATRALQRGAPAAAAIVVAPDLRCAPSDGAGRWEELHETTAWARPYAQFPPLLAGIEAVHLAAMVAGAVVNPVAAAAALVSWSAQPALVFAGGGARDATLRPPHLVRDSASRLAGAAADLAGTAAAGVRASRADVAERRARAPWPLPDPAELFEPPRDDCPWCGSADIVNRIDTNDLLQHKPGRFRLDGCRACGHVFQNPRLSIAGLDFYYDQFYDGLGEELLEFVFTAAADQYDGRLDAVARHAAPRAWLDVGTGHGHFCLAGRQRWPDTVFDGLDLSDSVIDAERRGWIDHAYRGLFPELADGLPRSYDVVSMNHYLEHTREPADELDSASKVLESGGHLLIELPDPECRWGRALGRWWFPWFQPQHQHFIPCGNLVAALHERNFEVVSVERGATNQPIDLTAAVALKLEDTIPSHQLPWVPPASLARRLARGSLLLAAAPVLAAAAGGDHALHALRRSESVGNTYRVVARKM